MSTKHALFNSPPPPQLSTDIALLLIIMPSSLSLRTSSGFQLSTRLKVIGFALLGNTIGLKNLRHFFIQSEVKNKNQS